jgi:hypothetical protein
MSVIPLTIFFSLLLAGTFVVLFSREQRRRHLTSPERDSLLPLSDETPVTGGGSQVTTDDHDHASGRCGCRDGARPPCAGCLKHRDEQEPAYF